MTDRELLEMAAKAAGVTILTEGRPPAFGGFWVQVPKEELHDAPDNVDLDDEWLRVWNPLTDDGDALRMAVKLNISLSLAETASEEPEAAIWDYGSEEWSYFKGGPGDRLAATRRAIVRAAAAIGERMTEQAKEEGK